MAPANEADGGDRETDDGDQGAARDDARGGAERPGAEQDRQAAAHADTDHGQSGHLSGSGTAHAQSASASCAPEGEPSAPCSVR